MIPFAARGLRDVGVAMSHKSRNQRQVNSRLSPPPREPGNRATHSAHSFAAVFLIAASRRAVALLPPHSAHAVPITNLEVTGMFDVYVRGKSQLLVIRRGAPLPAGIVGGWRKKRAARTVSDEISRRRYAGGLLQALTDGADRYSCRCASKLETSDPNLTFVSSVPCSPCHRHGKLRQAGDDEGLSNPCGEAAQRRGRMRACQGT